MPSPKHMPKPLFALMAGIAASRPERPATDIAAAYGLSVSQLETCRRHLAERTARWARKSGQGDWLWS